MLPAIQEGELFARFIVQTGRTHANSGGLYMLGTILVIQLILFLIGALPSWGYHN